MRTYPGCVPNWVRTYPRGYCTGNYFPLRPRPGDIDSNAEFSTLILLDGVVRFRHFH